MRTLDRFKLLHGPYRPPKTRRGRKLFCEIRDTVPVGGYSDGRIPWPWILKRGSRTLIVCGDLARAVRVESGLAIVHHWGVCKATVRAWRRALDVPRVTEGTHALARAIAVARPDDRLEKARRHSKRPSALAKMAAGKRGKPPHPNSRAASLRMAKGPRSAAWRAKMAAYWRRRGHPPGHPESKFWTPAEEALLGTAADLEIARRLGRTTRAVNDRRVKLGIPRFRAKQ